MHMAVAAMGPGLRERLVGLCDAMEARLHGLRDSKRRVVDDVHEIRKLGKALRGGLALVGMDRPSLRAVAAIGRLLAGPRDAVSCLKTWRHLGWDDAQSEVEIPAVRAVTAMLEKLAHSAGRRPPQEAVAWAVARIDEVRAALAGQTEAGLLEKLPHGVRRLRRRMDKRLGKLGMRRRDAPAFHQARKAVKAWLGAQALLGEPADDTCVQLAALLGDENDLSALEDWLNARGFSKAVTPLMWRRLGELHHTLRADGVAARDAATRGLQHGKFQQNFGLAAKLC